MKEIQMPDKIFDNDAKFSKSVLIELIADRNLDVEKLSSSDYASSDVILKGTGEANTGLFNSRSGLRPWATDIDVGFKKMPKQWRVTVP